MGKTDKIDIIHIIQFKSIKSCCITKTSPNPEQVQGMKIKLMVILNSSLGKTQKLCVFWKCYVFMLKLNKAKCMLLGSVHIYDVGKILTKILNLLTPTCNKSYSVALKFYK